MEEIYFYSDEYSFLVINTNCYFSFYNLPKTSAYLFWTFWLAEGDVMMSSFLSNDNNITSHIVFFYLQFWNQGHQMLLEKWVDLLLSVMEVSRRWRKNLKLTSLISLPVTSYQLIGLCQMSEWMRKSMIHLWPFILHYHFSRITLKHWK